MIAELAEKLLTLDTRLLAYLVWGIGTTVVYAIVMDGSYRDYIIQRDKRSRRELFEDVGLFATAVASNLAIVMVLFVEQGSDFSRFLTALALGAFTGVGILKLTERIAKKPSP